MQRPTLITSIILAFAVGLGGGWWFGLVQAEKSINKSLPETARNIPILNLYGPIKEIKNGAIFLEGPKSQNPLENLPETREVVIGPDTKIIKRTQKDATVFAAENAQFLEDVQNVDLSDPTPPVAPLPYKDEDLKLEDLKVGDIVSVDAGRDIRKEKRFEAVSITINIGTAVSNSNTNTTTTSTFPASSLDPALTPPPPPIRQVDPTFVP